MKDEIHEDITVYEVDENYETIMIASSIETDTHVKMENGLHLTFEKNITTLDEQIIVYGYAKDKTHSFVMDYDEAVRQPYAFLIKCRHLHNLISHINERNKNDKR